MRNKLSHSMFKEIQQLKRKNMSLMLEKERLWERLHVLGDSTESINECVSVKEASSSFRRERPRPDKAIQTEGKRSPLRRSVQSGKENIDESSKPSTELRHIPLFQWMANRLEALDLDTLFRDRSPPAVSGKTRAAERQKPIKGRLNQSWAVGERREKRGDSCLDDSLVAVQSQAGLLNKTWRMSLDALNSDELLAFLQAKFPAGEAARRTDHLEIVGLWKTICGVLERTIQRAQSVSEGYCSSLEQLHGVFKSQLSASVAKLKLEHQQQMQACLEEQQKKSPSVMMQSRIKGLLEETNMLRQQLSTMQERMTNEVEFALYQQKSQLEKKTTVKVQELEYALMQVQREYEKKKEEMLLKVERVEEAQGTKHQKLLDTINRLLQEKEEFNSELGELKLRHAEEVADLKAWQGDSVETAAQNVRDSCEKTIAEQKARILEFDGQMDDLRRAHEADMAKLRLQLRQETQVQRGQMESAVQEAEKKTVLLKEAHQEQVDQLNKRHNAHQLESSTRFEALKSHYETLTRTLKEKVNALQESAPRKRPDLRSVGVLACPRCVHAGTDPPLSTAVAVAATQTTPPPKAVAETQTIPPPPPPERTPVRPSPKPKTAVESPVEPCDTSFSTSPISVSSGDEKEIEEGSGAEKVSSPLHLTGIDPSGVGSLNDATRPAVMESQPDPIDVESERRRPPAPAKTVADALRSECQTWKKLLRSLEAVDGPMPTRSPASADSDESRSKSEAESPPRSKSGESSEGAVETKAAGMFSIHISGVNDEGESLSDSQMVNNATEEVLVQDASLLAEEEEEGRLPHLPHLSSLQELQKYVDSINL